MRSFAIAAVLLSVASGSAFGQDRFVERAPIPRLEIPHTMERAGNPLSVNRFAIPSVPAHNAGGYIGGQRLFGHRAFLTKGALSSPGAVAVGTYGTDYAGITVRPGRVFLAPSYDPSIGPTVARAYRTDGPQVTDVFALRPVRKAVLEAREDREGHSTGHGTAPSGSGHE
ncbi:MAG: hypothetical protein K8U57_20240 [Planctomycetes bacterium]|nr:hypothetical protein [Planctomycetota bacterium]